MKKLIKRIVLFLAVIAMFMSCSDDFLERIPQDQLSEEVFFTDASHLEAYVNKLYQTTRYRFGYGDAHDGLVDVRSDVVFSAHGYDSSLDTRGSTGIARSQIDNWNNGYDRIRETNYFIENYFRVTDRNTDANQYIGEGYFFRAWNYFQMLVQFGGVPIIDKVLNVDSEELYTERASRDELARFIIKDLDSAIVNLSWKNSGPAKPGRINKEAALAMKARVGLFEGTWERYHGNNSTPFAVSGNNGSEFLNDVVDAVDELIVHQGASISTDGGFYNEPYNQLFAQNDASQVAGLFWYRQYQNDLVDRSNNFYEKIAADKISITRRLVDQYLDKDGIPTSMSTYALNTMNEQSDNLDPRFRETVWTPNRGALMNIEGRSRSGNASRYPRVSINREASSSTGYRLWKGAVLDDSQYRAGEVDHILIRYGEALMAYAEAKAVLGTISQSDLDKTVNVLRGRVGMAPMNLGIVNGWVITYDETFGFDNSETNIVNEIRRERTVELALEGFRLNDLKRWARLGEAINDYKPEGAPIQEFLDYYNLPSGAAADGVADIETLTSGDNVGELNGNIQPFFQLTQFQPGGEGLGIEENRDYLSEIPRGQIDVYSANGVTLTQNPGWN